MNKWLMVVAVSAMVVYGFFLNNENSDDKIENISFVAEPYVEKIPLYYNLDNPEIIYTKDKEGNYEEVELDGI